MYYLGLDIGGTYIKIGIISSEGEILQLCKFSTGEKPLEVVFEEIDDILKAYKILGIGVAVAGIVDRDGKVIEAANIKSLNDFELKKELEQRYKIQVAVENDATMATLAEAFAGEGKGCNSFILLTLGTGIGGGFWFNGKVERLPMEVGHMTINYLGKLCSCGNTGCLEAYASARALKDNLIEKLEKGENSIASTLYEGNFYKIKPEDIYKIAMDGDPLCRSIMKEGGKALGAGLSNLINLFSPEKIILTGGLSKAVNIYIETAIAEAQKRAMKGLGEKVSIVTSSLVDKGGVLGAVMALNNQLSNQNSCNT